MRDKGGTDVSRIHGQTLSVPRPSVLTIVGDALRQVDDVSNVYLCRRTAYCNRAELCAHSYLACQLKEQLGVEQITIGLCTVCIAFLEMNAVAHSNVACCRGHSTVFVLSCPAWEAMIVMVNQRKRDDGAPNTIN